MRTKNIEKYSHLISGAIVLCILYLSSTYSYLLFHTLAELFSIIIAGTIFILAWNSRHFLDNSYLLYVGVSYIFVAGIDLVHTLAYKGMGVFPAYDANLPTQLWIAARYLQSISLLVAPVFLHRSVRMRYVVIAYTGLILLLLFSVFRWGIFPDSFIEGVGLTPFKKASEYLISLVFAGALGLLIVHRRSFDPGVLRLLALSILVSIFAELAFTVYNDVYGLANMTGHILKIVAFYLIYKAIVETGFVKPYDFLFRNLKQSEEALRKAHDELEIRVQERTLELVRANEELRAEIATRQKAEMALRENEALLKRSEAELKQYRDQLEELVEARTAELQAEVRERQTAEDALRQASEKMTRYAAELSRSNRELQDFASIASHDLQEPLRKIQAFGERLKTQYAPVLAGEGADYIDRMQNAAARMQKMLNDLLAYSRVATQALPLTKVELSQVVKEVVLDLEVRIEETGGRIELGDLPKIDADLRQMRQLFQNLIGNALKFHRPNTPPRIKISAQPYKVLDGCRTELVQITIEDNGIGFDEKYLERIFQPFQRLHTRLQYEGNGIGLAICSKIVERHGGSITARSTVGQGTQFIVSLPCRCKVNSI